MTKINSQQVKLQHYVPQFHLRNFTIKKRKNHLLYCIDRLEEREFRTNVRNIAGENYFYEGKGEQELEKDLSLLESQSSRIIRTIIKKQKLSVLSQEDREILASYILKQGMRTKDDRETLLVLGNHVKKHMAISGGMDKKLNISPEKLLNIIDDSDDSDDIKEVHKRMLTDENLFKFVEPISDKLSWRLLVNKTKTPFLISDNPLTRFNPIIYEGNGGLLSRGINLYLPLNSKISLLLIDPPNLHVNYPNNSIQKIYDEGGIRFANILQIYGSQRHIFSHSSDFSFVKQVIKNDSSLKMDKNRTKGLLNQFGDRVYEAVNNIDPRLYKVR